MEYKQTSEVAQMAQAQHDALAKFAISADVLVTIIVIAISWFDSGSAKEAMYSGVTFFFLFGALVILTLSGTLKEVWMNGQNNRTQRQLHRLQYNLTNAPAMTLVEPPRLPLHSPPAQPQLSSTFVAPVDDGAQREAAAWLLQLYQADGTPDPKKVLLASDKERPGRIRIAGPSRAAKELLLARHIIHDLGNGYRLALSRCPTIHDAHAQLAPLYGAPSSPTYLPTHPQEGGEYGRQ